MFFFLLLLTVLVGCDRITIGEQDKPYQVLVILSYKKHTSWSEKQYKGIVQCFKQHKINAEINSFYLDADSLLASQEIDTLNHLMNSYNNKPLDLIITCEDQATFSLYTTEHPLTKKVPIVFCAVEYPNDKILKNRTNITGFTSKPDYKKCYDLAQQLFGEITQICVTSNNSFLAQQSSAKIKKQLGSLPNLEKIIEAKKEIVNPWRDFDTTYVRQPDSLENPLTIKFINLKAMDSYQLKWELFQKPGYIFLMPNWTPLFNGLPRMSGTKFLMANNKGFGDGRLGGYMTPPQDQGYQAAETGIRILTESISPSTLPIQNNKQIPMFDWQQLRRWDIKMDKLPPNSVVINMPFVERYQKALWGIGLSLSVTTIIILLILNQLYRTEKANKKRILDLLIKEQNELNITMESISEGVISTDSNGIVFAINQAALNWLQFTYSPDTYIGLNILQLLDIKIPNNTHYLENLLQKAYHTTGNYPIDPTAYLITADGLSFPISGSLSTMLSEDDYKGAILTFRNITNEMTQREFLALSAASGDIFAWKYDALQKIFVCDSTFLQLMQWEENEKGEIPYCFFLQHLHPDHIGKWEEALRIIASGQHHHSTQLLLSMGDQKYMWWEFRMVSQPHLSFKDNQSLFGLCMNINYLKQKEKELEKTRDIALVADQQKSLFLSNMSHEIRTPLNAIVGFSEILTDNNDLPQEDQDSFIAIINENCRLLLNLVNDILDISRIESGVQFKQDACELNNLILELIAENQPLVSASLVLQPQLPEASYTIQSDKFRIRQILNNLLSNAFKFTDQGSITIGYKPNVQANTVCFIVKDTGTGIPPEEQSKIFERFYKSDNFTQGGGLGLPICHEIVRRMNGFITLESKPGIGSCFYVTLPDNLNKKEETV